MEASTYGNIDIDICLDSNWYDVGYANDVVILNEDPIKLRVFVDRLKDSVGMFGMCFTPSKCKMLLQNWIGPKPNRFL